MENLALRGIHQTNIQQPTGAVRTLTNAATTSPSPATSPTSPSQRALHAASGNAVPVTPERARIQAERAQLGRSVSLPKGQRQVPSTSSHRSVTAPVDGDLTTRTAELLEQFPEPPGGGENAVRIKQAPLKRRALSLSLFPRTRASTGAAECLQGPGQGLDPVIAGATFNLINREPSSRPDTGMSRYFSANSTALGTRAVSQQSQSQARQRRESDQLLRAVANGANRFGVESPLPGATNTVSTTQEPSTPSRPTGSENDFPLTPVTVTKVAKEYCPHKLAKLKKKEAVPIALTERSVRRLQLDGTSSSQAPEGSGIAPDALAHPTPSQQEPSTGTTAQVATPSSYLGLTQQQNQPRSLDHTSQHPGTLVTTTDFAPNAHTGQAMPPQGGGHRDSILSLGAPSSRLHTHITPSNRQRRQSTWRTRMQRTKCWKCELEARRAETAEMFRRRTETVRRGLAGTREGGDEGGRVTWGDRIEARGDEIWGCLRWTCFCRYRGYDSEDEGDGGARRR